MNGIPTGTPSQSITPLPLPPLQPQSLVPAPVKQMQSEETSVKEISPEIPDLSTRSNEVLAILTGLIKSDHSRAEDMSRRLQSMACDWSGGKLNADIQQRLMSMSKLLTDGDFSGAERIRVALAMDYSTECVAWITAIKHIIPASSDNVQ